MKRGSSTGLWSSSGQKGRWGALLVDWKTDRVDSESAQVHAQRYLDQLNAYRGAVAAIEGLAFESVQACILFPRAGIRVTLES